MIDDWEVSFDATKRTASFEPPPEFSEDREAQYRATHSRLLTSLYGPGRPAIPNEGSELSEWGPLLSNRGAIICPTSYDFSRSRDGLLFLAKLASSHRCPLVIFQSHEASKTDYAELRGVLGDNAPLIQVDFDHVHPSWEPYFESAKDDLTSAHKASNLSWKRTLGVMVAVRLGLERVFFVDDDITPYTDGRFTLSPEHLAFALRVLDEDFDLQAVSWPSIHMADNGVVGHARPLVGLGQDVFISGSAILLRVTTRMAFFLLYMYNEDWFMMVQLVAAAPNWTRALARAGGVRQKPYDAFSLKRAQQEEPGELVGEGLMSMLEDEGPALTNMSNVDFWARVKQHRREMLHFIIRKGADGELVTWRKDETPLSDDPIIGAMNAALWANDKVAPEALRRWALIWWEDQAHWHSVLSTLAGEAAQKLPVPSLPELLQRAREPWLGESRSKQKRAQVVRVDSASPI